MTADPKRIPSQNRSEPRRRSYLGGEIIFNGGKSTLECLVRNLSDRGTLLTMSSTVGVPNSFTLNIKQRDKRLPATVIWRDETSLGVAFDGAAD